MRFLNTILICTTLVLISAPDADAREWLGPKANETHNNVKSKAAGCSPATTITEFFVNNVRTAAETGGNTWFDRPNGLPYYEVPAGGLNHALYAGSLWMGGRDPAGNLKLAAVRFRQLGSDFWPGPLTVDGTASTIPETCEQWDKFFLVNRQMVETHRYYFTLLLQGEDPSQDPLFEEEGYQIPRQIMEWPAHGDQSLGQSEFLAPFQDLRDPETLEVVTEPGFYEPELGDYPLYDLDQEIDCRTRLVTDPVPLFGDFTMYWIFNDNGNIHTESQGEPIGMEIQAQMFGFTTNDEVNNMTFCNYVLINRGTLTLNNTYFAQWVDSDLGNAVDDYVGCDVGRGLGFSYNGTDFDDGSTSGPGYGAQPPAIGVDFFEGPYQDADGINNLVGIDENQALNGLGYLDPDLPPELQDTIDDNERFGMRRFVYHSNTGQGAPEPTTDPTVAVEYYNMMRGIWKDGTPMTVGGLGYAPKDPTAVETDFMFPGTSDPLFWGTGGEDPNFPDDAGWTEETSGNPPGDRRFIQSAGPFTLSPGQFNNITVGVVYARAQSGGPFASVRALLTVDDKAQALFENCFRLLDGPNAPDLTAQELDREIIFYLRNTNPLSNNQGEEYTELDPTIPPFNEDGEPNDQFYRFQGYQVFQLANSEVSIAEIDQPESARLVFQCDVRDGVTQIINYEFDEELGLPVPREMVNGANDGIRHSFRITTDRFASGDNRLVNFKMYYFLAVAYGHNEYEQYNPDPNQLTGQALPYIRSRRSASGEVSPITVIPHKPNPREYGTIQTAQYGDGIPVTRIEGQGNGDRYVALTKETIDEVGNSSVGKADTLHYLPGRGPLDVKVVDPLNVVKADFELRFVPWTNRDGEFIDDIDDSRWFMADLSAPSDTLVFSEQTIRRENEQIIPEYGISVTVGQAFSSEVNPLNSLARTRRPFGGEITYHDGPEDWLSGVSDVSGTTLQNWIRSGTTNEDFDSDIFSGAPCYTQLGADGEPIPGGDIDPGFFFSYAYDKGAANELAFVMDPRNEWNNILGGIIAPARLASFYDCGPAPHTEEIRNRLYEGGRDLRGQTGLSLNFTPDKDRWTRCPVLEAQSDQGLAQGGARKMRPRNVLSVDKNGRNQFHPDVNLDEATYFGQQVITQADLDIMDSNEINDLVNGLNRSYPQIQSPSDLIGLSVGMGWFPGFAFNPDNGERLNMMFAENSFLTADNGRDMLWNPSGRESDFASGNEFLWGGEHYIYVLDNDVPAPRTGIDGNNRTNAGPAFGPYRMAVPMYDGGRFAWTAFFGIADQLGYENVNNDYFTLVRRRVLRGSMSWVMIPLLSEEDASWRSVEDGLVPGEATINVGVGTPFAKYAAAAETLGEDAFPWVDPETNTEISLNNWRPAYRFSTDGLETVKNDDATAETALDMMDIVPNPYYAYSAYETSRVENKVRFVNLPPECKIQIFTINGTLVRILEKDNNLTWLDWDLQNEQFIPIAGGMYLIHVQAPGVGERVLKFFCATRPTDLRNF